MSTMTIPQQWSPPGLNQAAENGSPPEDSDYEIVDGQRVELPRMSIYSNWLNIRLNVRLSNFVDANKLGRVLCETMFILDAAGKQQRKPDSAFVSASTWPLDKPLPRVGDWQVVPDLAVEVVSPNDLFEAVLKKVIEYFSLGVTNVWVVSPDTMRVFVFHSASKVALLGPEDELSGGDVVPGFRLKFAELFETTVGGLAR